LVVVGTGQDANLEGQSHGVGKPHRLVVALEGDTLVTEQGLEAGQVVGIAAKAEPGELLRRALANHTPAVAVAMAVKPEVAALVPDLETEQVEVLPGNREVRHVHHKMIQ